jgi:carboxyl-terminal processing protease
MFRLLHALAACAAVLLTGCAALDPHEILTRRVVPASAPSPADAYASDSLDAATRRAAFERVWRTVDERYYDPAMNGVDWKAAVARWQPLVLEAPDDAAFWDRLDRMAGELRDVHTRVESPARARLLERSQSVNLGFDFGPLGEVLAVTSVDAESGAWWAGVRPGMLLLEVDGEPARAVYGRLRAEARDGSTEQQRHRLAARRLLSGEPDTAVQLAFERADGTRLQVTLRRMRFTQPPRVAHRRLPDGTGYIRLTAWDERLRRRMIAALTGLKDAPALVIDLRGNGGGSGGMVHEVARQFFEGERPAGRRLTRTGQPITLGFGLLEVVKLQPVIKGTGLYRGPVAILVDAGSGSASELFAGLLQAHQRVTVVGRVSCGCLLGFLGYAALPGGGRLAYSEMGFVLPDGRRIEGTGVVPDVPVPLSLEDLRLGRDRTLEAAVAALARAQNAAMPVIARPRISAWMSCVPS